MITDYMQYQAIIYEMGGMDIYKCIENLMSLDSPPSRLDIICKVGSKYKFEPLRDFLNEYVEFAKIQNKKFKEKNNNFLKYNEELFNILEFKGVNIDAKKFEQKCPFNKINDEDNYFNYASNDIIKLNLMNYNSVDPSEIDVFNMSRDKLKGSTSPIETRYNNYESNNGYEFLNDLELDHNNMSLEEEVVTNAKGLRIKLDKQHKSKKELNVVPFQRSLYSTNNYGSEISKYSEYTKSDLSRCTSNSVCRSGSNLSNNYISEVSNDFEFNEQNSCEHNSCDEQ